VAVDDLSEVTGAELCAVIAWQVGRHLIAVARWQGQEAEAEMGLAEFLSSEDR
jgi:hypothetical protein